MKKKKTTKRPPGNTVSELAKEFGKPIQSMRGWCAQLEPVGKIGNANLFDRDEVKRVVDVKIARVGRTTRQQELEERKLELQILKLKNETDIQVRNLLPVGDVLKCMATLTESVRSHLLAMPKKLAPLLEGQPPHEIQRIIKEQVYLCLNGLQETKFK